MKAWPGYRFSISISALDEFGQSTVVLARLSFQPLNMRNSDVRNNIIQHAHYCNLIIMFHRCNYKLSSHQKLLWCKETSVLGGNSPTSYQIVQMSGSESVENFHGLYGIVHVKDLADPLKVIELHQV